jgi:predicted PurR-regulated permease PerM
VTGMPTRPPVRSARALPAVAVALAGLVPALLLVVDPILATLAALIVMVVLYPTRDRFDGVVVGLTIGSLGALIALSGLVVGVPR